MSDLVRDIRYAVRALARTPGFTALAIGILALGIGANGAVFSLVDTYLLRPLPFPDPDRLVVVSDVQPSYGEAPMDYREFRDLEAQGRMLNSVGATFTMSMNYTDGELPERLRVMLVSDRYLELFGTAVVAGRLFAADEAAEGGPPVAVVTEGFWRTRLGGRPDAVGEVIRLDGRAYSLVGVVSDPAINRVTRPVAAFLPLAPNAPWKEPGTHYLQVLARMPAGATVEGTRAELAALATRLQADRGTDHGFTATALRDQLVGNARQLLWALLGAVGFVLLIAAANVANLLLVRAAGRGPEFAVRAALGAGRWRLIRQLVVEGLVLGTLGATAGVVLATWGTKLLGGMLPDSLPRFPAGGRELRLLGFAAAAALGTTVLFGLAPALFELRTGPAAGLGGTRAVGGGGRRAHRARAALVVSELALSLVLLVGAGLMIRSFTRLVQVRPGFRPEGVLTMSAVLAGDRYGQPEQRIQFLDAVTARIATLPGVTAVAAANNVPFSGGMNGGVQVEGRTLEGADVPNAEKRIVTDGYFGTMGIPVRQGRTFGPADRLDGPKVVVISETMARRLWPNESAVGRRIRSLTCGDDCWEEVVGVVGDVREAALDQAAAMEVYYPATQAPPSGFVLLARAADDPASLITPIRQAVAQIDGLQPVYNVQTLSQIVSASVADRRLATLLLSAFAGVALVLAAIGIGGVISYAVSQRTREIGLRIALGSRPQEVTRLVVGQGVRLAALGLGFGVPAALALSRFLRTQLYGVAPTHPLAYALAAAAVVGVAIAASWIPAWRATRVSPMEALRHE